jgi:hypothetical protein
VEWIGMTVAELEAAHPRRARRVGNRNEWGYAIWFERLPPTPEEARLGSRLAELDRLQRAGEVTVDGRPEWTTAPWQRLEALILWVDTRGAAKVLGDPRLWWDIGVTRTAPETEATPGPASASSGGASAAETASTSTTSTSPDAEALTRVRDDPLQPYGQRIEAALQIRMNAGTQEVTKGAEAGAIRVILNNAPGRRAVPSADTIARNYLQRYRRPNRPDG